MNSKLRHKHRTPGDRLDAARKHHDIEQAGDIEVTLRIRGANLDALAVDSRAEGISKKLALDAKVLLYRIEPGVFRLLLPPGSAPVPVPWSEADSEANAA